MPKHTYWFTYLIDLVPAFKTNAQNLGESFIGHQHPDYKSTEPVLTALVYMIVLLVAFILVRRKIRQENAVVPSDRLTLVTFVEVFFGYFYNMTKDIMGPVNAKRYFPIIAGSAAFIMISNIMGLVPGFGSPTTSLNVTLGCSIAVFLAFNYYGLQQNGFAYIKHFAGPMLILAPLVFPIEVFSTCVRVVTLAMRLMVNIAVDHLLASIFLGLVTLFIPIPIAVLGVLVCVVQTLVFALLTAVYIGLATEKHEHDHDHGGAAHAH